MASDRKASDEGEAEDTSVPDLGVATVSPLTPYADHDGGDPMTGAEADRAAAMGEDVEESTSDPDPDSR